VLVGVVALLAGSAPVTAPAAPIALSMLRPSRLVNVTITGSLTVSWSGDPARGCAAAGLCGVTGSVEMLPTGTSGTSGGPAPLEPQDETATIREVTQSAAGAVVSTCADVAPVDFTLSVRHVPQGLRAVIPVGAAFLPPSSGPCAGPTASDLVRLTLSARRFGAHSYDLSGTTRFSAGPFDVVADSTLRALVTYGNSIPGGGLVGAIVGTGSFFGPGPGLTRPTRTRPALEETADVQYRIQAVEGSLSTTFSGLPAPLCAPLGACGDSGRLVESIAADGSLSFSAARIVPRPVGRAVALRDLRSGRMRLNGFLGVSPAREVVSETLVQRDGTTCTDSGSGGRFDFQVTVRRRGDQLQLVSPGGSFGVDPLRTRCPGPSAADVLGGRSQIFAAAPLAPSELGRRHLTLSLSTAGTFSGLSWSGSRGGTVVLTLTQVRERAGTHRVRLVLGEPGVTLP
jgi:hypothetical protein